MKAITNIEVRQETQFTEKATIITLNFIPNKEEMDALFCDDSIVLEF